MARIALWQLMGSQLSRLAETPIDLEKLLETWIEQDPSLLAPGLAIVGRQLTFPGSGRLDLLGLDLNGTWTVIEIKKGAVDRDTVAQALDYASAIASLPSDDLRRRCNEYLVKRQSSIESILRERQIAEIPKPADRDVAIHVVGTGIASTLERIASFLNERSEVPISAVSFDVFSTADGKKILAREIAEGEEHLVASSGLSGATNESVLSLADSKGTGALLRRLFEAANALQLYPRPWKTSIMFTHPSRKNRTLFTAWAEPVDKKLSVYLALSPFPEFFPVTQEQVQEYLGAEGWQLFDDESIGRFISGLQKLLASSVSTSAEA